MSLRNILQSTNAVGLVKNYFFLTIYNVINLIIPLVIAPYLIRTVGIEKYGLIAFCQSFMTYFMIFTDYGFNVSGPRSASIARADKHELSRIFSRVVFSKVLLLLISFVILFVVIIAIPKFRHEIPLVVCSFTLVVGQILQPIWFLQGIEEMKFITILNVIGKAIFTVLVFLLIKQPDDYIYANALQGLGSIVTGILGILLITLYYGVNIRWVGIRAIRTELKESWPIFISGFSLNIYLNSNSFILGLFASPAVVGYYSVAEKVMLIVRQLLTVFSQAVYPHVCKVAQESHERVVRFFRKTFPYLFAGMFLICFTVFVLAGYISTYLIGHDNSTATLLIRMLCIIPLIVACNIPAYLIMLAHDMKKKYTFIFVSGALLSVISNTILAINFQGVGTVISIGITELFITIALHKILYSHYPQYSYLIKKNPHEILPGQK